jgi:hypothetical protein
MTLCLFQAFSRIKPKLFRVVTSKHRHNKAYTIKRLKCNAREECILALVAHSSWFVVGEGVLPAVGAGAAPRPPAKDKLEQERILLVGRSLPRRSPANRPGRLCEHGTELANALRWFVEVKASLLLKQERGFRKDLWNPNSWRIGWNVANVEPDGHVCIHGVCTLNALLRGKHARFTTVSRIVVKYLLPKQNLHLLPQILLWKYQYWVVKESVTEENKTSW